MTTQSEQQSGYPDWEKLYRLFDKIATAQVKTEQWQEEAEQSRKEFEAQQRRWREEAEQRQKKAEEEQQRWKQEAEQRQKKAEEEQQRWKREAEQRQKEFEAQQRRWIEEAEQRRKQAEEEDQKRKLEDQKRKLEEEQHKLEEEQRRKQAEEEDRQWKQEEKERERQNKKEFKKLQNLFTSQWGRLVESLVEGDLVPVLNARGIEVDHTTTRMGGREFEFDILAINGKEMVIVEVKTTLRPKNVKRFLKQLDKAKTYMPQFANHIIYGAMAWLKADSEAEKMAEKRGLFVIRATGKSASIINDKDFKPHGW